MSRRLEIAPTTLAKKAALAPSTVNRFLSGKGQSNLGATTIDALVKATATLWADRLGSIGQLNVAPELAEISGPLTSVMSVSVVGAVQAGAYQEAAEWPDSDDMYTVKVPVEDPYRNVPIVGLEVRGPSMDLVYPEGTVVICVPFYALDRSPQPGERVVVHRQMDNTHIEATVKEFRIDEDGVAWLVPLSSQPEFQAPLRLGKSYQQDAADRGNTDEKILITLLVIGSYRRESRRYPAHPTHDPYEDFR